MSTLWWVRHGPTHARTMIGWTDLPADLSDLAALARLEALLPQGAPVISSDLARAVATADALSGARPRLAPDADLREIDFGAWENRSHDEVSAADPICVRQFWECPGEVCPPGGEGWDRLRARVDTAADRLCTIGSDVIVVAHFGPILTQYQRAAGLATTEAFAQPIAPLSLSRFRYGAGRRAELVNHLA